MSNLPGNISILLNCLLDVNTSREISNVSDQGYNASYDSGCMNGSAGPGHWPGYTPDFLSFLASLLQPKNLLPAPLPDRVVVTFIVLYTFIIVLAVVGNSLVIAVIVRHESPRSVTDMYILSLAISDLLIAVLNMPFQLYYIIANEWLTEGVMGEVLCKFTNYIQGVTIVACVLTLTAIAIDRYIVICHQNLSRKVHQKRAANIGIVTVWAIALCVLSPHLVFQKLDKRLRVSERGEILGLGWVCAEFYPRGKADGELYSVFVYVFLYCIPVLVMTFTYGAIAHRLWIRKPIVSIMDNPGHYARSIAQKKKITKLLMVLVLAFTVLWLPFFTFSIYSEFREQDENAHSTRIKMAVLQMIGYSNCCVNPIIYPSMNNNFQREFKRQFCFWRRSTVVPDVKTDSNSRV